MRRVHYDQIDSTNTEARRLLTAGSREPLLVTAVEQTAGRGRQGRDWHSPVGGAWLSLAWPTRRPPAAYGGVSLAAAAAVLRALRGLAGRSPERFEVKWPNDVLVDGRKVAGILCEQRLGGGVELDAVIVGVGVNVNFDLALLPADLRHPATTLEAALAKTFRVGDVVDALAGELGETLETYEAEGLSAGLLVELRASLAYVGRTRTWVSPAGEVRGVVAGLDDAGRLLLDGPSGRIACESGELAH